MKTFAPLPLRTPCRRAAILVLLLLAALSMGAARGHAQTILNGSFESPVATYEAGGGTDWNGTAGAYTVSNSEGVGTTPFGSQFLLLDAGGSDLQTVTGFVPGATYQLTVEASAVYADVSEQLRISVSGGATGVEIYTLPRRTGSMNSPLPFTVYALKFTAASTAAPVSISMSNISSAQLIAVDNVQLLAGPLFTLYNFSAGSVSNNVITNADGANPAASLLEGRDGNFYGTTANGGTGGGGVAFQLTPAGAPTTLYDFTGSTGSIGLGPLIQARDDNFYGTTQTGGTNSGGSFFQLTAAGNLNTLYSFGAAPDAPLFPAAGVIQGNDDRFYGTAEEGGAHGDGDVFAVSGSGTETDLDSFSVSDGMLPVGGLIQASDGNFYGTTNGGGANGDGTVFEVTPAGMPTTLYNFSGGTDGGEPDGGALVQGRDGKFYGADSGGVNNGGTIFVFAPGGGLTTLHSFGAPGEPNTDGYRPNGSLIQGLDDNFYGTAQYGGANGNGTIFEITAAGTFTTLYAFSALDGNRENSDGASPEAGLIQASDGNFCGTTSAGGAGGNGTVFELLAVPIISSAVSANGKVGVAFSYQIKASNEPVNFAASGLPGGLSVDANSGLISGTPTASGIFTVAIVAANANAQGTATLTLNILPAAPVITSATSVNAQVGVAFSYQIAASSAPTSYAAGGLPPGLATNKTTGIISGTPTKAGTYAVKLTATNAGGTGSATLTLTVLPPTPAITSPVKASGVTGTAFSYQITGSNAPTGFAASGLPAGLTVDNTNGLIAGTPTAAGTFPVMLSATNAGGTGTATLTLTIAQAKPVITSATSASAQVGKTFTYQITATNNPTGYMVGGLKEGLSLNKTTGLISGAPTAAGTLTLALYAANAGGSGHATLTLTIAPAKPVITSPTTAPAKVGVAFSYQITASNNPTSFVVAGLRDGLSLGKTTGVISGTPTTAGTLNLTLTATNSTGNGSAVLTLTVTN